MQPLKMLGFERLNKTPRGFKIQKKNDSFFTVKKFLIASGYLMSYTLNALSTWVFEVVKILIFFILKIILFNEVISLVANVA